MTEQEFRIEHDTMGEVKVPVNALWRAQTQRAVENFPISGRGLEAQQIRALGLLKAACAQVNKDMGNLDAEKADAIIAAAKEIADGKHNNEFPIDVFQTGSGTSSNMNTNEVIASIAKANGVEVHPNDHVNMGQSSNDTFPTATHVAATEAAANDLIPALQQLQQSLAAKAQAWHDVVKSGRTHLMDATPITLGQEFSGYARQIELGIERVQNTLNHLGELAIGGTAVGTGINTPAEFGGKVTAELVKLTGVEQLSEAKNHFEAQANRDGLVEFSGAMRSVAVSLYKIANDIRLMGSGPLAGLAEIHLPTCSRVPPSCRARSTPSCARPPRRSRRRSSVTTPRLPSPAPKASSSSTCSSQSWPAMCSSPLACWPIRHASLLPALSTASSRTRSACAPWPSPRRPS